MEGLELTTPCYKLVLPVCVYQRNLVFPVFTDEDVRAKSSHSYNRNVICQLLTHIPDSVINYNQKVTMPARKECIGVAMFADISGKDCNIIYEPLCIVIVSSSYALQ